MDQHTEGTMDTREIIKGKLRECFDGRIVRKDLTKKIKEGANVPVYVLEFLLGQYCSSDDEEVIEKGVENVKRILVDNFVRPDEAQKILSVLRARGSYTVIDKITVSLNIKRDVYEAEFSNLGLKAVPIADEYPEKYDRLLCGGIWCIVQLDYEFIEEDKSWTPLIKRSVSPSPSIPLTKCLRFAILPSRRIPSGFRTSRRFLISAFFHTAQISECAVFRFFPRIDYFIKLE